MKDDGVTIFVLVELRQHAAFLERHPGPGVELHRRDFLRLSIVRHVQDAHVDPRRAEVDERDCDCNPAGDLVPAISLSYLDCLQPACPFRFFHYHLQDVGAASAEVVQLLESELGPLFVAARERGLYRPHPSCCHSGSRGGPALDQNALVLLRLVELFVENEHAEDGVNFVLLSQERDALVDQPQHRVPPLQQLQQPASSLIGHGLPIHSRHHISQLTDTSVRSTDNSQTSPALSVLLFLVRNGLTRHQHHGGWSCQEPKTSSERLYASQLESTIVLHEVQKHLPKQRGHLQHDYTAFLSQQLRLERLEAEREVARVEEEDGLGEVVLDSPGAS
eukprot:748089-Hanusia_phi.AAC.2